MRSSSHLPRVFLLMNAVMAGAAVCGIMLLVCFLENILNHAPFPDGHVLPWLAVQLKQASPRTMVDSASVAGLCMLCQMLVGLRLTTDAVSREVAYLRALVLSSVSWGLVILLLILVFVAFSSAFLTIPSGYGPQDVPPMVERLGLKPLGVLSARIESTHRSGLSSLIPLL